MNITERIAQHILEVHEGGNWTEVNIKDTLDDVNYYEAVSLTRASYNTIASLLNHLSYYNNIVLQRLSGNDPAINESNGFDVEQLRNENSWNFLKEQNLQSAQKLAAAVRAFPEEKLFEKAPHGHNDYYGTLHGIVEHAHYHLGQIVLLKKLIRQGKLVPERSNSL